MPEITLHPTPFPGRVLMTALDGDVRWEVALHRLPDHVAYLIGLRDELYAKGG